MAFEKGIAEYIPFTTYLATDHVTPAVPVNPVATISKDGAGFNPCANAVVSIATGACEILLSATEKTADRIHLRVTSDNCDPVNIPIRTEADWTAARAGYMTAAIATATDLTTLLNRLTAARAGYLDKLNVSGILAHSDAAATYKADVSGLATALNLAAVKTVVDSILADTGTDGVVLSTAQVNTIRDAIFAKTGITALGVVSFNTILKAVYAMARGQVDIAAGAYAYKDDDDSTTLFTLTPSTTQRTTA
jgi:hypothetical protein